LDPSRAKGPLAVLRELGYLAPLGLGRSARSQDQGSVLDSLCLSLCLFDAGQKVGEEGGDGEGDEQQEGESGGTLLGLLPGPPYQTEKPQEHKGFGEVPVGLAPNPRKGFGEVFQRKKP